MRLTLLANGVHGPVAWDDALDLCDFLEATGRTIPRTQWAEESIALTVAASNESMF